MQESRWVLWIDFGRSRIVAGLTQHHPDAVQEQQDLCEQLEISSSQ